MQCSTVHVYAVYILYAEMDVNHLHDLVDRAQATIRQTLDDEDDFQLPDPFENERPSPSLLEQTRQSFRRRRSSNPNLPSSSSSRVRKRGRRKAITWTTKLFLFRRCNPDFFPSPNEVKHLSQSGYGFKQEVAKITRTWGKPQFEEYVHGSFPNAPLALVGFEVGHCDKARVVKKLEFQTVKQLENKVGKGKLLIIPRRDLPGSPAPSVGLASGTPTVSFNQQRNNQQDSASTPHANSEQSTSVDFTPTGTDAATDLAVNLTLPAAPSSPPATHATDAINSDEPPLVDFDLDVEDITVISSVSNVSTEVKEAFTTLNMSLMEEREITIRRANILEDVMTAYSDESLCLHKLKVTFEGESGDDFGGLTKEMFTLFWNKATQNFFHGENVTVPSIPLYRFRKEGTKYTTIGRILAHTAALTETIPCQIAKSAVISMVFEGDIDSEYLLKDYLLFVSPTERHMLKRAMTNFPTFTQSQKDRLTTFYSVNGLLELPKQEEIKDQILTLAEEILVKSPSRFYALMKKGIPSAHYEMFWRQLTLEHIQYIMDTQRPTVDKVISCLKTAEDLRPEEERAFYYLKEYIGEMNNDALLNFLLFVTASVNLPVDGIRVSYVGTFGLGRRPVAHTCANVLEVSTSYHSLQEFKREITAYLSDEHSYEYTIN